MTAAILIVCIVFLLPLFSTALRESTFVLVAYILVVLLHQIIAAYVDLLSMPIIEPIDSIRFHEIAKTLVIHHVEDAHFYSQFLGVFYKLFGASSFLGSQLSILAFSFSCIVFLKLKRLLQIKKYSATSLFVYGALPTLLVLGTTTLRETYEMLFFMIFAFYGVKILTSNSIKKYLVPMTLAALALGLTHKGLYFYAYFLIMITIGWFAYLSFVSKCKNKVHPSLVTCCIVATLLLTPLLITVVGWNRLIESLLPNSFMTVVEAYSSSESMSGRADYPGIDLSSPLWPILSVPRLYFYYLFSPFPWQIHGLKDLYAFGEMGIRITLLVALLLLRKNSSGQIKVGFSFLLCLYFSMVLMWSVGTQNYGTAMRHHLVTWWILVLALPFAIDWIKTRVLSCLVPKGKNIQSI